MMTSLVVAAIAAGTNLSCQDHSGPVVPGPMVDFIAAKPAIADAYVVGSTPNLNTGSSQTLNIAGGDHRTLVRFDQAEIAAVVGGDSLAGAVLQLTIVGTPSNWSPPYQWLALHRVTQSWTEAGATWNCAVDSVPGNSSQDCAAPNTWIMGTPASWPFSSTPTASAPINNSTSGVIQFNVTADVRAFLAGTANLGWILKKADENQEGQVSFGSKESVTKPQLFLGVVQGDTSRPVVPGTFTIPRDSTGLGLLPVPGSPNTLLLRDRISVIFDDSTSGTRVRAILAKYGFQVIGGTPFIKAYVVRVPNPPTALSGLMLLLDSVNAESGVRNASRVAWSEDIRINGRFPSDGPGAQRADWFAPTLNSHTRARWAVRAPLAWGCETGDYNSSRVRLGTVDYFFSGSHPDLAGNLRRIQPPESLLSVRPLPPDTGLVHHGTGIAGILAAIGDNNQGTAGMLWRADLFGFLLTGISTPSAPLWASGLSSVLTNHVFPMATDSGIRAMALAVTVNMRAPDTLQLEHLEIALRRYIQAGGLIVLAAGNDNSTSFNRAQVATLPSTGNGFNALLVLAARIAGSLDSGGILVVPATDVSNKKRQNLSNYVLDLTQVAAPGEDVRSLLHDSAGVGQTGFFGHTSIAAPFVAGVAGMLWQFDPTLSAAQVRSYIIRGTLEPRPSGVTGLDSVPKPIEEMATVRMLDAYMSLVLLARERVGLPVCGYPVRLLDNVVSVRLDAPGAAARTLIVPGSTGLQTLSVAQGGRRIAVFDWALNRTVIINHLGQVIDQTATGVRRSYLEEDTVDGQFNQSLGRDTYTIHGASGSFPDIDFFGPVVSPTRVPVDLEISPDGSQALVHVEERPGLAVCQPVGELWYVAYAHSYFVSRSGVASFIRTQEDCFVVGPIHAAWSHPGTAAVFSHVVTDGSILDWHRSVVTSVKVGQGSPVVTAELGRFFRGLAYSADDSLVLTYATEPNASHCYSQWMVAATHALLGTKQQVSDLACLLPREIPNAPPAYPLFGTSGEANTLRLAGTRRGALRGNAFARVN